MDNLQEEKNTNEVPKQNPSQEQSTEQSVPASSSIFQSKNRTKFIVLGIIFLFLAVSGGALVLNKTFLAPSQRPQTSNYQNTPNIPSPSTPSVITSSPTSSISTPELITGIYKNHYGEYQIKLPDNWGATGCMPGICT